MRVIEDLDNVNYNEKLKEFSYRCACGRLLGVEYSDLFLKSCSTLSPKNEEYEERQPHITCSGCGNDQSVTRSLRTACEKQSISYEQHKRSLMSNTRDRLIKDGTRKLSAF